MSKESIKAIIETNVRQNGQQLITGQLMQNVLKNMVDNEYAELDELATKMIEDANSDKIEVKVNAIMACLADLVTKVVFHSGVPYQLPTELRNNLSLAKYNTPTPSDSAICGTAICGVAICGKL